MASAPKKACPAPSKAATGSLTRAGTPPQEALATRRRGPKVRPPSVETKRSMRRSPDPCVSLTTTSTRFGAPGSTATSASSRIRLPGPSSRTVRATAPGAAAASATTATPASPALAARKLSFEALDHLDRPGVDPAQDGQVERHEIAHEHERQQPLGRALALGLYHEGGHRPRLDQLAGELDALAGARMQGGVVEEHGGEAAAVGRAPPT